MALGYFPMLKKISLKLIRFIQQKAPTIKMEWDWAYYFAKNLLKFMEEIFKLKVNLAKDLNLNLLYPLIGNYDIKNLNNINSNH
jgi:hypothetical protein